MPVQDRTNEFRACVDSIRTRSAPHLRSAAESKQRLLQTRASGSKSEFSRMANGIGKDISSASLKLKKLAQLAKRKTLFDDRPVEISELTYIIKQDIAGLNKSIAGLQAYTRQHGAGSSGNRNPEQKQADEHEANVVMLLQSKLANVSMTFKDVLEIRTQNMKESKDRTEQFMHSAASGANQAPSSQLRQRNIAPPADQPSPSGSLLMAGGRRQPETNGNGFGAPSFPDPKGKSRSPQNGDILAMDLVTAEEGTAQENEGGAFMQMQLVEQQNDYIQSRSTAIESIESTIAELGQIFTQLAQMVAEQRETVQRIDADVMDISSNVSGAQRELLKYYSSISSNRWLMLKIFGVLIVFFLAFVLVT